MSASAPWVLGVSASHNGAACLLRGDELVVAIQEERLSRYKRAWLNGCDESAAIQYCLDYAGIGPGDLSVAVLSSLYGNRARDQDLSLNPALQLGAHGVPLLTISHHLGHALSAFATSSFEDAAVLVVDGMGSREADLSEEELRVCRPTRRGGEIVSLYRATSARVTPLEKQLVEDGQWYRKSADGMPGFASLGGMFSAVSKQIFGEATEAGKVMGLAPYGTPDIPVRDFFTIEDGRFVFSDAVPRRLPAADPWPNRREEYQNLAASVQAAVEEALLFLARRLREATGCDKLCYAGGVALNSIANERLVRESGFRDVFVAPAAEDSGVAVGAAYHGLWHLTGKNTRRRLLHDAVGREYTGAEIAEAVARTPSIHVESERDVVSKTVDLLCDGKIIGWFQGRSELGPRALGQRSILCDPRRPEAKDVLNARVKHREGFRPFAPVILLEEVPRWFELGDAPAESPFMLRILAFKEEKRREVPAVVHVDGTGRLQTVTRENNGRLHELVSEFHRRTGVPIVLNTSFNVAGEPIVETPDDALWCLLYTQLDACVVGDRIVTKEPGYESILDLYPRTSGLHSASVEVFGPKGALSPSAFQRKTKLPIRAPQTMSVDAEPRVLRAHGRGPFASDEITVKLRVQTRWGLLTQRTTYDVLGMLELIDGDTSGWALLERIERGGGAIDAASLVRQLGVLRRAGILSFHAAPAGGARRDA